MCRCSDSMSKGLTGAKPLSLASEESEDMRNVKTIREFGMLWDESEALVSDFSAAWCGPCKKLEPVLKSLEEANPGVVFAKVDVDELTALSRSLRIQYVPTVFLVKRRRLVYRIVGHEIREYLSAHVKELVAE